MAKASNDIYMLLFGVGVIAFLGFLYWKISENKSVEFVRDDAGRVIQIIEKRL